VNDFKPVGDFFFTYRQACTPPQFFHAGHDNPRQLDQQGKLLETQWYDPKKDLSVHYLDRAVVQEPPPDDPDPCPKDGPLHASVPIPDWTTRLTWTGPRPVKENS
jgi:hypothetical protein